MSRDRLTKGNMEFVHKYDIGRLKELQKGQSPHSCVITCSDSRVCPEHIFNADLGDIFVIRTAGNVVVDPTVLGSIEYAVAHLKVPVVVVLGHSNCGALTAAMGDAPDGNAGKMVRYLQEMDMEGDLDDLVVRNIHRQIDELRNLSSVVRDAESAGDTSLVGAVYDLGDGTVRFMED